MTFNRRSLLGALFVPVVLGGSLGTQTSSVAGPGDPTRMYALPPELVGDKWLNVPEKQKPPALKKPTGKVTVIHFWTFG